MVENKELGEDQVELNIISGNDLDVVLAAEKCNTISISYNLGISSSGSGSGSGSETTDTGRQHIKINVISALLCYAYNCKLTHTYIQEVRRRLGTQMDGQTSTSRLL